MGRELRCFALGPFLAHLKFGIWLSSAENPKETLATQARTHETYIYNLQSTKLTGTCPTRKYQENGYLIAFFEARKLHHSNSSFTAIVHGDFTQFRVPQLTQ